MGKLYKQADTERPAIACFKEVLKTCPMSLEAAQSLMELGVKSREISELMIECSSQFEWVGQWIQGYAAFYNHDYVNWIQTLKQSEDSQCQFISILWPDYPSMERRHCQSCGINNKGT